MSFFSHSVFIRVISRLPPVLGYSVQGDLIPKWEHLRKNCQYASFELIRFPAYFSYPMDRVIVSRYDYLRDVKNMPVQLVPVDDILRYGDKEFATEIAGDLDGKDYANFQKARHNKIKRQNSNKNARRRKKSGEKSKSSNARSQISQIVR